MRGVTPLRSIRIRLWFSLEINSWVISCLPKLCFQPWLQSFDYVCLLLDMWVSADRLVFLCKCQTHEHPARVKLCVWKSIIMSAVISYLAFQWCILPANQHTVIRKTFFLRFRFLNFYSFIQRASYFACNLLSIITEVYSSLFKSDSGLDAVYAYLFVKFGSYFSLIFPIFVCPSFSCTLPL